MYFFVVAKRMVAWSRHLWQARWSVRCVPPPGVFVAFFASAVRRSPALLFTVPLQRVSVEHGGCTDIWWVNELFGGSCFRNSPFRFFLIRRVQHVLSSLYVYKSFYLYLLHTLDCVIELHVYCAYLSVPKPLL